MTNTCSTSGFIGPWGLAGCEGLCWGGRVKGAACFVLGRQGEGSRFTSGARGRQVYEWG